MTAGDPPTVQVSQLDGEVLQILTLMVGALVLFEDDMGSWTSTLIRKLLDTGLTSPDASRGELAVAIGELNQRMRFAIGADAVPAEPHPYPHSALLLFRFADEAATRRFTGEVAKTDGLAVTMHLRDHLGDEPDERAWRDGVEIPLPLRRWQAEVTIPELRPDPDFFARQEQLLALAQTLGGDGGGGSY